MRPASTPFSTTAAVGFNGSDALAAGLPEGATAGAAGSLASADSAAAGTSAAATAGWREGRAIPGGGGGGGG